LLVIEIADSSLRIDRETKRTIYAEAGVPEYWIVDVNGVTVDVHTAPINGTYAQRPNLERWRRASPDAPTRGLDSRRRHSTVISALHGSGQYLDRPAVFALPDHPILMVPAGCFPPRRLDGET